MIQPTSKTVVKISYSAGLGCEERSSIGEGDTLPLAAMDAYKNLSGRYTRPLSVRVLASTSEGRYAVRYFVERPKRPGYLASRIHTPIWNLQVLQGA